MTALADCLLAINAALAAAEIPYAFGGAIALGYCIAEPRGTRDLDINLFVAPERAEYVVQALPAEVTALPSEIDVLKRDGQVRLRWDETPIDLFLDVDEFHHEVARRVRTVSFQGVDIPVLDCVSLAVFKAFFSRGKDWVDIANMVAFELDVPTVVQWLEALLGPDDEVTRRMAEFLP